MDAVNVMEQVRDDSRYRNGVEIYEESLPQKLFNFHSLSKHDIMKDEKNEREDNAVSDFKYKAMIISYPFGFLIVYFILALQKYPKEWWVHTATALFILFAYLVAAKMPNSAGRKSVPEKLMVATITEALVYYGTSVYFQMGGNWKYATVALLLSGTLISATFGLAILSEDRFINKNDEKDMEREKLIKKAERELISKQEEEPTTPRYRRKRRAATE